MMPSYLCHPPASVDICLSQGFVVGVYIRKCKSASDHDYAATLQVQSVSTKHRSVFMETLNKDDITKHTTLYAVDGDLDMVTIKISS